jgi:hypothetical protein
MTVDNTRHGLRASGAYATYDGRVYGSITPATHIAHLRGGASYYEALGLNQAGSLFAPRAKGWFNSRAWFARESLKLIDVWSSLRSASLVASHAAQA